MKTLNLLARIFLVSAALAAPLGTFADDPAWIPINPPIPAPTTTATATTGAAFDNVWMCLLIPAALDIFRTTPPSAFFIYFR